MLEEVLALHAVALRQAHQPALEADEPLVDVVELLDQHLDAVVVQRQRLHLGDHRLLELLVFALLSRRERRVLEAAGDELILQAAQLLVIVRDAVENLEHARLEFRFHGGKRE